MLAFLHQVLRIVAIISLQTIGVLDANQVAVAGELVREYHFPGKRRVDLILVLGLQVGTRVLPAPTLTVGTDDLRARQREVPVA